MANRHATAEDFTTWEQKAEKLNVFGLHYATEDCWEAANAAAEMGNTAAEGYYRDELSVYRMAARKRLVDAPRPTKTLLAWDERKNQATVDGTCTVLATDAHLALVELHPTRRWAVVGTSMLK